MFTIIVILVIILAIAGGVYMYCKRVSLNSRNLSGSNADVPL